MLLSGRSLKLNNVEMGQRRWCGIGKAFSLPHTSLMLPVCRGGAVQEDAEGSLRGASEEAAELMIS